MAFASTKPLSFALILLCAIYAPILGAEENNESGLLQLKDFSQKILNGYSLPIKDMQTFDRDDRQLLSYSTMSLRSWEKIARSQKKPSPEMAFHLARHAYQLGLESSVVAEWVNHIPETAVTWFSAGYYLMGVVTLKHEKNLEKAKEYFAKSNQTAPAQSIVRNMSSLALARIAFSEKNYTRSTEIYSDLSAKQFENDSILHELAWSHFNQDDANLAYSDLYLLFSLYPDSDELFFTSNLLTKIYEQNESLDKGSEVLERLSLKFSVESENTDRAFKAMKGVEHEILYDIFPEISYSPARTIFPMFAYKKLQRHPILKQYAAELQEIETQKYNLEIELSFLDEVEKLWQHDLAISQDSLLVLTWANDLESSADSKKLAPDTSDEFFKIKTLLNDLKVSLEEIDFLKNKAIDIDQFFSKNWLSVSGEKAALAISIKQDSRTSLRELKLTQLEMKKRKIALEFAALKAKYDAEIEREKKLKTNSSAMRELEVLKQDVAKHVREKNLAYLKTVPALRSSLTENIRKLAGLKKSIESEVKKKMNTLLPEIRKNIADNLSEYQWSIAEARYKLFKNYDTRLIAQKSGVAESLNTFSAQMKSLAVEPEIIFPKNNEAASTLEGEYKTYLKNYLAELRDELNQKTAQSTKNLELFSKANVEKKQKERDLLREQAVLAFSQFVKTSQDTKRTPYALFRLAQLYLDRTRDNALSDYEMKLALEVLEKIRNDYPNYTYADKALYLLGSLHSKMGEGIKAHAIFTHISKNHPDSTLIHDVNLRMGEYHFNQRELNAARPYYEDVVKNGNDDLKSKALYKLAWCDYLEGQYEPAIERFSLLLAATENPDPKIASRYLAFADESAEYIAFSMYKLRQDILPRDFKGKVSNPIYGEKILKKAADIYFDRGDLSMAIETYDTILTEYPSSPGIPTALDAKIKMIEKVGPATRVVQAKEQALLYLSAASNWRKANSASVGEIKKADDLGSQWLYELAHYYEQPASLNRPKAIQHYQALTNDFPTTTMAYEAEFRLAEIAFEDKDYARAAIGFDRVVRNEAYVHRRDESLYNIVAAKNEEVKALKDISVAAKNNHVKTLSTLDDFSSSVDNLAVRAPQHPKVAESMFESANLYRAAKEHDKAVLWYEKTITFNNPGTWKEPAYVAQTETLLEKGDLPAVVQNVQNIKSRDAHLTPATLKTLNDFEENAAFNIGRDYEKQNELPRSLEAFTHFQKSYPDSPLASKAVFNAILLARKLNDKDQEENNLQLLITKYETSREAKTAFLEKAVFYDSIYEVDDAIIEYESAIRSKGLTPDLEKQTLEALARLIPLSEKIPNKDERLLELSKKTAEPLTSQILLEQAQKFEDAEKYPQAILTLESIEKSKAPLSSKVRALSRAAVLYWKINKPKEALKKQETLNRLGKKLSPEDLSLAAYDLAELHNYKFESQEKEFKNLNLRAQTPDILAKTFKRKAGSLAKLEQSVIESLKYPAPDMHIRHLEALHLAYHQFADEMMEVELPKSVVKEERSKFRLSMKSMSDPLREKAKTAKASADQISKEYTLAAKTSKAVWPELILPPLPASMPYNRDSTFPTNERTVEYLSKAIEAMKHPWSKTNRDIATSSLSKSLFETPNYPPALYNMAILHLFAENASEFRRVLTILKASYPEKELMLLLATHEYLQGNYRRALDLVSEFRKSNDSDTSAIKLEILSLLMNKKYDDALVLSKKYVRSQSKDPWAHRLLARAFSAKDQKAMAKFILGRSMTTFPDVLEVKGELAPLLVAKHEKWIQTKLVESAAAQSHPESLSKLSKLNLEAGQLAKALEQSNEAFDNGGRFHPEIVYNRKLIQELVKK